MKTFLRSLSMWLALVANMVMFGRKPANLDYLISFALPAIAMALTVWSVRRLPQRRWLRLAWWMVTLPLWTLVILFMQGQVEASPDRAQQVMIAGGLALIVMLWRPLKNRTLPPRREVTEFGMAFGLTALLLGGVLAVYEIQTRRVASKANARWAEIGRPMDEFYKGQNAEPGNAALEVLGKVIREQTGGGLYKLTEANKGEPSATIPPEFIDVMSRTLPPADVIPPANKPSPLLDARSPKLDLAYQEILAQEVPVWAAQPQDGFSMRVPNFLAVRMLAQTIAADSIRRLERGDVEGANRALTAGLHATAGLQKSPALVSVMVKVAVDCVLTSRQVRLPVDPTRLDSLADDSTQLRLALCNAIQTEALTCVRLAQSGNSRLLDEAFNFNRELFAVPFWARHIAFGSFTRRQCHLSSLCSAEAVAIFQDPHTLAEQDLGERALDRLSAFWAIMSPNYSRAYQRLNASLLLREQTDLLRLARSRMDAGLPVEPHASVVLPGLQWQFTADPTAHTVSMRLDKVPEWISSGGVAPPEFWQIPLDGSKAWQFREPTRTVAN